MPCNNNITDLAPSPINVQTLAQYLVNYDEVLSKFLLDGFSLGFNMQYTGPRQERNAKNLKSIDAHSHLVQEKNNKEVLSGRVAGPFSSKPLKNFIVSPIGIVPKKTPGEFRMIHHLSYPEGSSINDFTDPSLASVQYTSFDKAVELIQKLGPKCKLFKMDIRNAFKLLPIRPEDFELLGFQFRDSYYFDKSLAFGSSISCATFEKFSTFLEHCVQIRLPSGELIHYLDDFLGGDKSTLKCRQMMNIFESVMHDLNVPLSPEKTEGPSEIIIFLGLELDSNEMTVRIPKDKIEVLVSKIKSVMKKKKVRLKELQSLIGSLNFCCRAIPVGRPFCRRLINATCGITKSFHYIRVLKPMKADLAMWLWFFQNHNGVSVFHDRFWQSNDDANIFTDSAGGQGLGFGIYCRGHWTCAKWPESWHSEGITKDITVLELFPILVALFIWGPCFCNMKIRFNCDNSAVVHVINTMSSKSDRVMSIVRLLTLKCLQHNILVKASHLPGAVNVICDSLSRFQMTKFRQLAPNADREPQQVPDSVWTVFSTEPTSFCITR